LESKEFFPSPILTKGEQASALREALLRNAPTLASEGFKQAGFLPYKYAVIIANKCPPHDHV
jgi:hypothetical protein